MNPRPEVMDLVRMGPFPPERGADLSVVKEYERLYRSIVRPVSDDEARLLMRIFGEDDFYGIAASVVSLIETAPGWPLEDCLNGDNLWIRTLRERCGRR
jgi:hypothetical protein